MNATTADTPSLPPHLLSGKTALICGVANKWSIAWSMAETFASAGAQVAITCQDPRLHEKIQPLIDSIPGCLCFECDLTSLVQLKRVVTQLQARWKQLDVLVHSVAFARKEDLAGRLVDVAEDGFELAQRVSTYTLLSTVRELLPLLNASPSASVLALTYLGSQRVVPHYHLMGVAKAALEATIRYLAAELGEQNIRVNGLSAGPISTLAARAIPGFVQMLEHVAAYAPLKRNITTEEVADAALFFASQLSRGITGEVLFVDAGFHIMGL